MTIVEEKNYVYWWSSAFVPSTEVAAFDMDHTIIKPQVTHYTFYVNEWRRIIEFAILHVIL